MPMYADLIIPVPIQKLFTYSVPASMEQLLCRGCRVLVQFGKKKFYSGIVMEIHNRKPDYETKDICEVVDTEPIVKEQQLTIWQWIADYYICTLGEVMKASMPQGLKLESESRLIYNALYEPDPDHSLTPKQTEVLEFISNAKVCTISEVANAMQGVNPMQHIRALLDAEAIYISEELRDAYKPRTVNCWTLSDTLRTEEDICELMDALERRAPRQLDSLMTFVQMAGGMGEALKGKRLSRDELAADARVSLPAIAELTNKGILRQSKVAVSRLTEYDGAIVPPSTLSEAQAQALKQIETEGADGKPMLLYGVTGSGKTEIYIHLMDQCLRSEKSVLYLLPEIALTTQITERLRRHFGKDMVVYHSKFSDAERVEVWHKLMSANPPRVILGVRSSVLLPLPELGLIIVDEEHEGSYKQYDPAPRYNARDMAVVIAQLTNMCHKAKAKTENNSNGNEANETNAPCRVVLGSATPSLESWSNVQSGKYGLVRLEQRHKGLELPKVEVIDMTEARHRKEVDGMFSLGLKGLISGALEKREQVILFQNRRGFSPVVECQQCAWVPKCTNCDVSLTYHKASGQLVCHYCGYSMLMPTTCPVCGTPSIKPQGFGTEKIEEKCKEMFPQSRVARMDLDTARSRKAFEELIGQFAEHKHDILIGTQMVTKGLDFECVSTVGVMNADALLNMPDFRADERSYQLMAQVSGRAGRHGSQGKVIIQTGKPSHPVIECVQKNDYEGNARRMLAERQMYSFPPFTRLISLIVKHREQSTCLDAARNLSAALMSSFGQMVHGPIQPVVARISNLYMQEIMLKMPRQASPRQVKQIMMQHVNALLADQRFHSAIVRIDVDPY